MRLPTDARFQKTLRLVGAFGLCAAALSGCTLLGGDEPQMASAATQAALPTSGPAADYPMVLGEPFTVDGQLYTPEDVLNYDEVGYAALDNAGGAGITISHRTLPLPSYVEITSLESGKTILARAERRGPMTGSRLVALSSGARTQLSASEGAAIRVRRVNPPELERAELRAGREASSRLETPQSLVAVLRDRLPERGSASLRSAEAAPVPGTGQPVSANISPRAIAVVPSTSAPSANGLPARASRPSAAAQSPSPIPARTLPPIATASAGSSFAQAFQGQPTNSSERQANTSYPLVPLEIGGTNRTLSRSVARRAAPFVTATASNSPVSAEPAVLTGSEQAAPDTELGRYEIQAAAFSNRANASRAAETIEGSVVRAGRFFRVRTGPYATRAQAEAALAKVRAAGYSDARVFTTG